MTNNSPIQMLEDEHLIIAKVIGAVSVLADRLEAGQVVDVETLQGVIEFMQPTPMCVITAKKRSCYSQLWLIRASQCKAAL